ncbi:MAG: hypothetical protein AAGU76_17115 [Sedimentibacter sp.]|uniref:hypothetical protein n=1 Tax=Sedimentibacter sp. TaxID=1960295 RepID=UPI003158D4F7
MNTKGSVLVFMVICSAVIAALGVSILSTAMIQYNIKRTNTEARQAFYMAETGLNEAFSEAYILVIEARNFSKSKAEEYLVSFPEDEAGAESVFSANFKSYILSNFKGRVESSSNPAVAVTNTVLIFYGDCLTANLRSVFSAEKIDRKIDAQIVILVPTFSSISSETFKAEDYVKFANWTNY